jgi:hypothetical protein
MSGQSLYPIEWGSRNNRDRCCAGAPGPAAITPHSNHWQPVHVKQPKQGKRSRNLSESNSSSAIRLGWGESAITAAGLVNLNDLTLNDLASLQAVGHYRAKVT